MKEFVREYIKIIVAILCTALFSLGFYNLYVNLLHQDHINQEIVVTNLDQNYNSYQDNVKRIESNLNNYSYNATRYPYDVNTMEKLRSRVKVCVDSFKRDGGLTKVSVYDKIRPFDLYKLNTNFLNEVVNQCWISGMSFINLEENDYTGYLKEVFPRYDQTIKVLINNANYIKFELMNNSSYHYSTSITRDTIRNEFLSQYNMVINNYKVFSDIILEVSEFLVKGEY